MHAIFNWSVFLWWLSLGTSIYTFVEGVAGKSWVYMLVSTVTFLPVAYYLYYQSPIEGLKYLLFFELITIILTILFWWLKRKRLSA